MVDVDSLKDSSSIEDKNITCEILTPMLMHGCKKANKYGGKIAELRIPSIKGLLRYWWRSVQQELPYEQLLEKEQELFGGTSGSKNGKKSLVLLSLQTPLYSSKHQVPICPHKYNKEINPLSCALEEGQQFIINLRVLKKDQKYLDLFYEYVRFMMMLSGFGQRARRGAGAVQMVDCKWQTIKDFKQELKKVLTFLKKEHLFNFEDPKCLLSSKKNDSSFPILNHVWIGKPFDDPIKGRKKISWAGHIANSNKSEQFLGKIRTFGGERQASPIHATIRKIGDKYYPIISEVIVAEQVEKKEYCDARNIFLECLGVEIDEQFTCI